ncbi:MAG: acyl-CoA dehydratase activase-related protein, partial [Clostridium sp.]|nr:acyl-CoA dehydratase activase-related protein [Clostridium sp.]
GQDSKYISIENKLVKDFEMNKICAAGTGAFIEEQIKKLDVTLNEFGPVALKGENPCDLGDRCTVFIEGNIGRSIGQGESIENICSGLAYSIVKNYLNKVVGRREIGNKIFLQGGIAHNQAVVNAFRSLLGREIIVPPFFSVTGALGAAVLGKKKVHSTVHENNELTAHELGNKYFEEGYVKEIDEKKKTVGIPRVLFINKMFPMFNEIFKRLGYNVVLSDVSNEEIIKLCQEYSCEETCFPVKLINGHVGQLVNKKVDYIFLPHLHTMKHSGSNVREDYACVYMQTSPKIIESTFNLKEKDIQMISPVLSFNFGKEYMIKTLLSIGEMLGKNKIETTAAVMAGMKKFMDYEHKLEHIGADILKNTKEDEKVFVIVSRVYNIVDPVLNMGVEKHLKKLGYKVIYLSHLEASHIDIADEHDNMYWPFGQHLLTGARVLKKYKNLYPVYITNHGCGPDTVLLHYMKKELEGRPYLHLEVDEHSSKVGVITRIEAFVTSLDNYTEVEKEDTKRLLENIDYNENQVLIPNLYPYSDILKSFLERTGRKAVVLDEVNENSIEDGKVFARSKEYFSLIGMLAEVMNKVKNEEKVQTLYLPTDEGSEVFGQYGRFIKQKADETGRKLNLEA